MRPGFQRINVFPFEASGIIFSVGLDSEQSNFGERTVCYTDFLVKARDINFVPHVYKVQYIPHDLVAVFWKYYLNICNVSADS